MSTDTSILVKSNDLPHFKELHQHIWGQKDMHVGLYKNDKESIEDANENIILKMIKLMPGLKKSSKMLMMGTGYGDVAHYLVDKYRCQIDCVDIDDKKNKINEKRAVKSEFEKYITVTPGNFQKIPFKIGNYDIVWSQEAFFHVEDKRKVFREIARVLRPEGRFIFADLLKGKKKSESSLKEMIPEIYSEEMLSADEYQFLAGKADLEKVFTREMPESLSIHYNKLLEKIEENKDAIIKKSSKAFVENQMGALQNGIEAIEKEYLSWGILQFQKRNVL